MAVRNSLLEKFSGKFRRCWKILHRFSGSARCYSGVNKSARERIGRQNLSQKVPPKKGSLGVIFSPRNYRENAHSKSANFEGRHSGGHLLGRPLFFTPELSLPRFGHFPARKTAAGKLAAPAGTLLDFLLRDRHSLP